MPRARAPTLASTIQYATTHARPDRPLVRRWLRAALAMLDDPAPHYALTVRFVDADEARALNRDFRGRDYATNVLTFPYPDDDGTVSADVVVCLPVVDGEAREQGKRPLDHCAHLVVHGTLHAAGLDHEGDADATSMEALERAALARLGIADPYVVRTPS